MVAARLAAGSCRMPSAGCSWQMAGCQQLAASCMLAPGRYCYPLATIHSQRPYYGTDPFQMLQLLIMLLLVHNFPKAGSVIHEGLSNKVHISLMRALWHQYCNSSKASSAIATFPLRNFSKASSAQVKALGGSLTKASTAIPSREALLYLQLPQVAASYRNFSKASSVVMVNKPEAAADLVGP